jgi:hypothetical protein
MTAIRDRLNFNLVCFQTTASAAPNDPIGLELCLITATRLERRCSMS